jgi:hypothetical protein
MLCKNLNNGVWRYFATGNIQKYKKAGVKSLIGVNKLPQVRKY